MLFHAMDKNKNGKLEPDEMKVRPQDGNDDPMEREKAFAILDTDGDGVLSFKEAKIFFDKAQAQKTHTEKQSGDTATFTKFRESHDEL